MGIPPLKHVVDDLLTITPATASVQTITLAKGTINPNYITNNTDIRNGSIIRSMTLQLDISVNNPTDANGSIDYDWYVGFNIANAQSLPNPNSVGGSDLAPQIFHQDQGQFGMSTTAGTGVCPASHVVRLVLKVPRSWSKFANDDQLQFRIQKSVTNGTALLVKLRAIYYEIFP